MHVCHLCEHVMTPRRTQVLRLIAQGLGSDQIAAELSIASNTVKTHVADILGVLGAKNRPHAVAIGYERGLLGADGPS